MHCVNIYCIVRGRSRGSFIVVPTGADVTGTNSILSLILSLFALMLRCSLSPSPSVSECVFLSISLFFAWTRWRDALLQTFLTQDHNALSHVIQPAISCLSLCLFLFLSMSARSSPFFLTILSPLTKADKGLSFLQACLSSVCLYCTKLASLTRCSPPSFFGRKVSRGCGAPALRQGACLGSVREVAGVERVRCGE